MATAAGDVTRPHISNVVPPTKVGQGYIWLANFELIAPALGEGWIIQEVHKWRRRHLYHPLNDEWHYWEAWQVSSGAYHSTQKQTVQNHLLAAGFTPQELAGIAHLPFYGQSANDMFSDFVARPGSRGEVVVKALARFHAGALPPDFTVNNPKTQAGSLRSSVKKPPFWKYSGAYRRVKYEWDFTVVPPRADLNTASRAFL